MKSTNWSKFLEPVHVLVSTMELSSYAVNIENVPVSDVYRHSPGIWTSASSIPDIFEKVFACIDVM